MITGLFSLPNSSKNTLNSILEVTRSVTFFIAFLGHHQSMLYFHQKNMQHKLTCFHITLQTSIRK